MINCDFKVDLFWHRMTDVFKGFRRGMAQWLMGSATRGSIRLSLPTSEPERLIDRHFRRSRISGVGRQQLFAGVIAWVFGR